MQKVNNQQLLINHQQYILYTFLAIIYAIMHCGLSKFGTFESYYELSGVVPFVNRMLVSILVRPLHLINIPLPLCYFIFEVGFSVLLLIVIEKFFKLYLDERISIVFTSLFLLVLTNMYLNYHPSVESWFYSYDTPSMFFVVLGLYLIFNQKFKLLLYLIPLATLNRESSILLILIFMYLYYNRLPLKKFLSLCFGYSFLFAIVRILVSWITRDNLRPYGGDFAFLTSEWIDETWRYSYNFRVLINNLGIPILIVYLSFLPIFLYVLRKYIPSNFKMIFSSILFYISLLFFVGNFNELRIFEEVIVIIYIFVCIGLCNYIGIKVKDDKLPKIIASNTIMYKIFDFLTLKPFLFCGCVILATIFLLNY